MKDGTAKINMAKPEKPYERTRQGTPFHISLEMHRNHSKGQGSDCSYDIYAFGVLLWVLCEGSGSRRPQAYDKYSTIAAMKLAVEKEIYPERPLNTTHACWELMTKCWQQRCVLTANDLCQEMEYIILSFQRENEGFFWQFHSNNYQKCSDSTKTTNGSCPKCGLNVLNSLQHLEAIIS